MEYNHNQLPFLDCQIVKHGQDIHTDIFYKPTDSKCYLLYSSCHPKHTKRNIPFSLAKRLRTIISDDTILDIRFRELEIFLRNQDYPLPLIRAGILKAKTLDRYHLLKENPRPNEGNIIPFITTHNPLNPYVFGEIKKDLHILNRDPKLQLILSNTKFINSKRQAPNLKKTTDKSYFPRFKRI